MGLHKINKDKPLEKDGFSGSGETEKIMGFTSGKDKSVDFDASQTIDPDSPNCYAKRMTICGEGGTRYKNYIKMGLHGYMYNPWGLYSEGTQHKDSRHTGKAAWEFRQVNEKAFNYYLRFLQTRNTAWLNNSEREVRNA